MHQEINKSPQQKPLYMRISASSKNLDAHTLSKIHLKERVNRGALLWPASDLFVRWQCFQSWTIGFNLVSCIFANVCISLHLQIIAVNYMPMIDTLFLLLSSFKAYYGCFWKII